MLSLASKFEDLTDVMTKKYEFELQEKKEKAREEPIKKFEKLSPVIKNTILMFIIEPGMTEDEIVAILPTSGALSLLNMQSGSVIKSTRHQYLKNKGCVVYLQNGLCTNLKNLMIASTDPFINENLNILFCGPENPGEEMTSSQQAIIEEKARLGILKKDDLEVLTKNNLYTPMDFWGFEHMVNNFVELIMFLGGEDCYAARAWKRVRVRKRISPVLREHM